MLWVSALSFHLDCVKSSFWNMATEFSLTLCSLWLIWTSFDTRLPIASVEMKKEKKKKGGFTVILHHVEKQTKSAISGLQSTCGALPHVGSSLTKYLSGTSQKLLRNFAVKTKTKKDKNTLLGRNVSQPKPRVNNILKKKTAVVLKRTSSYWVNTIRGYDTPAETLWARAAADSLTDFNCASLEVKEEAGGSRATTPNCF